jgi:DNA-binding winged helix-turn-helix (wHTH) protein/TolB-like protein
VDLASKEIWKEGQRLPLPRAALGLLVILLERAGDLVTREELRDRLWPADSFADFGAGLEAAIRDLREALGDDADSPRLVQTVPQRGYRFLGPVLRESSETVPAAAFGTSQPLPRLLPVPTEPKRSVIPLVLGAALLGVCIVGLRVWARHREPPRLARLAVLPFETSTGDAAREPLADGISEEIIGHLAGLRAARVTAWTSARAYRRTTKTLGEIAGEIGVDALVTGTVRATADHLSLEVGVIDPVTGRTLLARSHEGARAEVLSLESAVAMDVVNALHIPVTSQEASRLRRSPTVDPRAHEACLRGRGLQEAGATEEAELLLEEATRLDPSYAPAYSALAEGAWAATAPGSESVSPVEGAAKAREAARAALGLDPGLDAAKATLALVEVGLGGDAAAGDRSLSRILVQSPSQARVREARALLLAGLERADESVAEAERAHEIDPWSRRAGETLGRTLYYARRYEPAIAALRRVLDLEPDAFRARLTLAQCYWQRHEWKRAIPEAERALADSPSNDWVLAWLGFAYGASGDRARGRAALVHLDEIAKERYVPAFYRVLVHVGLDEMDAALGDLAAVRRERSGWAAFLRVEPDLDAPRKDPRFEKVLRAAGPD